MRAHLTVAIALVSTIACKDAAVLVTPGSPGLSIVGSSTVVYVPVDLAPGGTLDGFGIAINDAGQATGSGRFGSNSLPHAFSWDQGTLSDLTGSANDESRTVAINAGGTIVGTTSFSTGLRHATLWQHASATDLGTLGGPYSEALDINDNGQVAGWSYTAALYRHAFRWEGGALTDLGTLGGSSSEATAINGRGDMVGFSYVAGDETYHAFVWHNGLMTDLGTLGGGYSWATDLNDAGQVVGFSLTSNFDDGYHAFLWDNGVLTDLGATGAYAINEQGQVVGYRIQPDGNLMAVLWDHGSTTDLGTLGGGNYTAAVSINDVGQIAGFGFNSNGLYRPFVWENGTLTDLGTLGGPWAGMEISKQAINNEGQIVGFSVTPSGNAVHPVIWEPRTALTIDVDIKPASVTPRSPGMIPVAVLSGPGFDATTVDAASVRFGPTRAPSTHQHVQDANGDRVPDLLLQFRTERSGIACGETQAVLSGQTTDGRLIYGSDVVEIAGCK